MRDLAERARGTKEKGKEAELRREEWRPPWRTRAAQKIRITQKEGGPPVSKRLLTPEVQPQ